MQAHVRTISLKISRSPQFRMKNFKQKNIVAHQNAHRTILSNLFVLSECCRTLIISNFIIIVISIRTKYSLLFRKRVGAPYHFSYTHTLSQAANNYFIDQIYYETECFFPVFLSVYALIASQCK